MTGSNPGITVNIYSSLTGYTIPGKFCSLFRSIRSVADTLFTRSQSFHLLSIMFRLILFLSNVFRVFKTQYHYARVTCNYFELCLCVSKM